MPIEWICEVQFDFQTTPITAHQRNVLIATLSVVPSTHRIGVRVNVGDFDINGGAATPQWRGGGPLIQIRRDRFEADHNQAFNETLLHEMGHLMDYRYNCLQYPDSPEHQRAYYRRDRLGWRILNRHAADYRRINPGGTQGEGEVFADGYSGLIRHMTSVLQLNWDQTRQIYAAIVRSPAFDCCRCTYAPFVGVEESVPVALE